MQFREWLNEHAGAPGSKQTLYPLGYGGISLYSPSNMINWSADAITYMPPEDRRLQFNWGKGMLAKPEGLEIHNIPEKNVQPETGKSKFKWGKGMLSKPDALIDTIPTLHTQPRDSGDGVKFIWGKGILAKSE